ncbi:MAG: carbohydrate ABC transporter substrate-binding protein, partial [Nocardioidaceae bacterium]|nr:carbohydrate ABC transporter substrate-binding protein [Nocardioidaceae bacterium]
GGPWAEIGGWLSPHTTFDASQYPDDTTREMYSLAAEADVFKYDASDLMPGSVGAGTFWDEMNAWVGGDAELEEALANIEESWPGN